MDEENILFQTIRFPDGMKRLHMLEESTEWTDFKLIYDLSFVDTYQGKLKANECEYNNLVFEFKTFPYSKDHKPREYTPKPKHRIYVNDVLFFRVMDYYTASSILRSINRRKRVRKNINGDDRVGDLYRKVERLTHIDADNKIITYESPPAVAIPTEEMYEKLKKSRIGKFVTYEPIPETV